MTADTDADPNADPTADPNAGPNANCDAGPDADFDADPNADPTPPRPPRATGPVQYRGADLEPSRGPGLGCFRFQLVVLIVFVILTPLSAVWGWPEIVSAALLFAVVGLLLTTGQTIIFLLRLVAADRRSRRRPMGSATKTVGELEDEAAGTDDESPSQT